MPIKLTADSFRILGANRGLEWIGKVVVRSDQPTEWQCARGHLLNRSYNRLRQMKSCPQCLRKNEADYHSAAEKVDALWIGKELPANASSPTLWQCRKCQHIWSTKYGHIQQGHGCALCGFKRTSEKQRFGPEQYKKLGESRELTWLEPAPRNCFAKTLWRCVHGHVFEAAYHDIQQGKICRPCGLEDGRIKERLTKEDFEYVAAEMNIEWLGDTVKNSGTTTDWRCAVSHVFRTSYDNIKAGRMCRLCGWASGADKQRFKPDAYLSLAQLHGLEWLGPPVQSIFEETEWRCAHGHEPWFATYSEIKRNFHCPGCRARIKSERRRLPDVAYMQLAEKRNMEWLGPSVGNANQLTKWRCVKCKFEWMQKYAHVYSGSGCPWCAAGIGQRQLFERVKSLLPNEDVFFDKRVPFLQGQHFDIYVPAKAAALEYHGRQHYVAIESYGGESALQLGRERDQRKRDACKQNGTRLLEVPFFKSKSLSDDMLKAFLESDPSFDPECW